MMKELDVPATDLIAIDPGPTMSAFAYFNGDNIAASKVSNADMRGVLGNWQNSYVPMPTLAIEMIASYGMAVGKEVFETCVWIGRFTELWGNFGGEVKYIFRRDVKLFLCGSVRATDSNIRSTIIDLYGGKEKAIGNKANPGPLYGIKADMWAALGVALTAKGEVK